MILSPKVQAQPLQSVQLAWDPSDSTNVAGYFLRYGFASRQYEYSVNVGTNTTATVPNLFPGYTYFFAVTAFSSQGLQSDYSDEISYMAPGAAGPNMMPTLDPLPPLIVAENAGSVQVLLAGISAGSPDEDQTLTIRAVSSNPDVLANPVVDYTSPSDTGKLLFNTISNAVGLSTITVTINDGGFRTNTLTRTFSIRVGTPTYHTMLIEAERGEIFPPMYMVADSRASSSTYIISWDEGEGVARYTIDIPQTDDYYVWCRVLCPDAGGDSFHVAVDGGSEDVYDASGNNWSSSWQWSRLSGRTTGNPRRLRLTRGTHQLSFRCREATTGLDAFYVTSNPSFVPVRLDATPVTTPVSGMQLNFQSPAGYRYDVQASEDMRSWTTIWRSTVATANQRFTYLDTATPASGRRFYRLIIQ